MTKNSVAIILAASFISACSAESGDEPPDRTSVRDTSRDTVGRDGGTEVDGADGSGDAADADDDGQPDVDEISEDDLGQDLDATEDSATETLEDTPLVDLPDVTEDAIVDGTGVYDTDSGFEPDPELCPESSIVPGLCISETAEQAAGLCDGFDNDCDGTIDEGCRCKLGDVMPCFQGPPGHANTGACAPGTQRCVTGADGFEEWGACNGDISPSAEVCDGLDNDCNGCTDEIIGCDPDGLCPGPGDPRTPEGAPFSDYALRGGDFYVGPATSWNWDIVGGPCDGIVPGRRSFELTNANSQNATFTPLLSGSYTVTLTVQTPGGPFICRWVVHIVGPGVRIEMCYPESMTQDVDLLLMRTTDAASWYPSGDAFAPNANACSWSNCEATLRMSPRRVNWGYANTDIAQCSGGPQGSQWRGLGYCANPRLDIDNNLSEGIGLPENINIDNPGNGDAYRIMLHNFTGTVSRPIVNVYCGGRLKATFGAAPDTVSGFNGARAQVGAMWRVADVEAIVAADGTTTDCVVTPVHPPGATTGYDVTRNDARY